MKYRTSNSPARVLLKLLCWSIKLLIKQLKKDLSFLNPKNGKTGQENLIALGVFDVGSQSVDKGKLKEILILVRKNRGLDNEISFEKLKSNLD